ncbi:unnamed protein product [Microthlaspi erraticum]|uniref:Uncharacterized protein n=1 Tax=Microthlaspi erraticum TaxID=1685480 RepID=A0A6D2I813_9BRAS|nr:unnamed protein product [Microthlaspi erraticum]
MWCGRAIGYNSSYLLKLLCASFDWSALDPIRFCISPLASHPLLKLILSPSRLVLHPDSSKSLGVSPDRLGILGAYPRPLSSLAAGVVAQLA